jgi:hypothetical protein
VEASVSGVVLVAGGGDELAFGRARSTPGASTRRMARLSGAETGRLSAATASVRDAAIESGAGAEPPAAERASPRRSARAWRRSGSRRGRSAGKCRVPVWPSPRSGRRSPTGPPIRRPGGRAPPARSSWQVSRKTQSWAQRSARPWNLENPLEGAAIDGGRGQDAELGEGLREQRSPVDGTRHRERIGKGRGAKGKWFWHSCAKGEKNRPREGEFPGRIAHDNAPYRQIIGTARIAAHSEADFASESVRAAFHLSNGDVFYRWSIRQNCPCPVKRVFQAFRPSSFFLRRRLQVPKLGGR